MAEGAAPEPSARSRRPRWPSSTGKRIAAGLSFATALVGLATGVVALVDRLQDDPEPERFARLADVTVEPMSFGDALARQDLDREGFTPARLACPVAFVNARVATTGYAGARLPVRWQLFAVPGGFVAASREDYELRPTANRRELDYPLPIPLPLREAQGRYYAVVRVMEENGQVPLATHRSPEFDAPGAPGAAGCPTV